jgi:hypothetical protein
MGEGSTWTELATSQTSSPETAAATAAETETETEANAPQRKQAPKLSARPTVACNHKAEEIVLELLLLVICEPLHRERCALAILAGEPCSPMVPPAAWTCQTTKSSASSPAFAFAAPSLRIGGRRSISWCRLRAVVSSGVRHPNE